MDNAAIIIRLCEIGPLPDDRTPEVEDFPLEEFDELLRELINPLKVNHALALINSGPPVNASTFEIEWALVHAAESISAEDLREILPLAGATKVRSIMEIRLTNYFKQSEKPG